MSLIPSDLVIRVVSIGFLHRVLIGADMAGNFHCVLYYLVVLYFVLWRLTYSESYGELCWGYLQFQRVVAAWPRLAGVVHACNVVLYIGMPSAYGHFGHFHRELYPKILILVNNAVQLLLFVIFMFVINRHLDGHHDERSIQYAMDDALEDRVLVAWEVVLSFAWCVYVISLYLFHSEGTRHLEEQLENLIPQYVDSPRDNY